MTSRSHRRAFFQSVAVGSAAAAAGLADVEPAGNTYINPRKVLLWESTRKEFREAQEGGTLKAMIVPTGSTEQHNEHLAMINDTASVTLIAQQAALQLYPQVMVATPVPVGISPHWMDRKGTLTLKKETFLAVVYEICESLKTHGVNTILILNGHGGNVLPLRESAPEFARNWASMSRRLRIGTPTLRRSSRSTWRATKRRDTPASSRLRSPWPRSRSGFTGKASTIRKSNR